jgi:hypothetical protein
MSNTVEGATGAFTLILRGRIVFNLTGIVTSCLSLTTTLTVSGWLRVEMLRETFLFTVLLEEELTVPKLVNGTRFCMKGTKGNHFVS